MLVNVLTIAVTAAPGVAVPTFGYLKYRAYTKTIRHLVDELGVDGLEKAKVITPPTGLSQRLTRGR